MKAYPINYSNIKDEKKASVALAATMFVSELAYEVAVRWVPILREDRTIFNRDLRDRQRKEHGLHPVHQRRAQLLRGRRAAQADATDQEHLRPLRLRTQHDDVTFGHPLITCSCLPTSTHRLTWCISRPASRARSGSSRGMEPQMRILEGIRMTAFDRYADGVTISGDEEMNIERSIKAIVEQLMKHSNDVCGMVDVELPEEIGK